MKVIVVVCDGHRSAYTAALPILADRPAVALVVPSLVGQRGYLTTGQCAALDAAGWDVSSHGWTHDNPIRMNDEELDEHLRRSSHWLAIRGFRGAAHYGPPLACDERVRTAALRYYRTVLVRELGPSGELPAGWEYRWVAGEDARPWAKVQAGLNWAAGGADRVALVRAAVG